jgi:hypothetical protein
MVQILKPTNLSLTWASGGDVLNPGDTKYATGWQVEIPPRQWFNYLDNRQDTALAHINQHGVAVWDELTEYQGNKSYVQGSTNGTIYRCVQTHINQNPETDLSNTYWIIAFASAGDFYTKAEVDGAFLAKASNLDDLPNTATARSNLSVYSQAQTYTKAEVDAKTTVASTAQAQAQSSNTTLITPLRLAEWSQANSLGVNQTWQNVLSSRNWATNYTNTTGRPIQVSVTAIDPSAGNLAFQITVGGVVVGREYHGIASQASIPGIIVPAGAVYRVDRDDGNDVLTHWAELR